MSIPKTVNRALVLILLFLVSSARAMQEAQPVHSSADKQIWDRKTNQTQLIGHAVVRQSGESLSADYILLDLNERTVDAKGNCIYITRDVVIYAEELHFNLDTHMGSIVRGRVSNDKFTLAGELIHKLADSRYRAKSGEYSTCHDCPRSWTLQAESMDMQIEGYGFMSKVTGKIGDVSAFWLPYLIVPMKTRRQTGFLFPSFGTSGSNGFYFVLPFFWAIGQSADMTVGVGNFEKRGPRFQWEGRYALSQRNVGSANFYYVSDKSFVDDNNKIIKRGRWALDINQAHSLPFGIDEKLKITEMSDNEYPALIGDVPGYKELNVSSDLLLSHSSPQISSYILAKRLRNLHYVTADPTRGRFAFDPATVQLFPRAVFASNDKFPFDFPLATGLSFEVSNFTRSASTFDYDPSTLSPRADPGLNPPAFRPGIDPIRKATRFSLTPSIYTTFRPWDVLAVVPSVQYNAFYYSFPSEIQPLTRGYPLFQTEMSAQIERVYETSNRNVPRMKHLIRPMLTYSYIPFVNENENHPFLQQIQYARSQGFSGYTFDNNDVVPIDNSSSTINYFVPLGHSLAYGYKTQLVRKHESSSGSKPTYSTAVTWNVGHAVNFREFRKVKEDQRPLSRFFSDLDAGWGLFSTRINYRYYPYIVEGRHYLKTSLEMILNRGVHQNVLNFDRSISLEYTYNQLSGNGLRGTLNYSISDYLLPSISTQYDFLAKQSIDTNLSVMLQSPSRCWRFSVNLAYSAARMLNFSFDLALNLTGSGFGGVTEVTNQFNPPRPF